jgi:hypothetical protein
MYGNWGKYNKSRYERYEDTIKEGFSGSCIAMRKNVIDKLGYWDEKIISGDFDFYIRSKIRNKETGDIKPIHILLGVYFHHFSRLTVKTIVYTPYVDLPKIMGIKEKWGEVRVRDLLKDIEY